MYSNQSLVRVMINEFHTITSEDTGKTFTVYSIEVIFKGKINSIGKRYSEFYEVYKKLCKNHPVKVNFPAKHVLNRDQKVLESRRIGIELYLQCLLEDYKDNLPQDLLDFLQLGNVYEDSIEDEDELAADVPELSHSNNIQEAKIQPLISFKKDVFLEPTSEELEQSKLLPNTVMEGVLQGIYS